MSDKTHPGVFRVKCACGARRQLIPTTPGNGVLVCVALCDLAMLPLVDDRLIALSHEIVSVHP